EARKACRRTGLPKHGGAAAAVDARPEPRRREGGSCEYETVQACWRLQCLHSSRSNRITVPVTSPSSPKARRTTASPPSFRAWFRNAPTAASVEAIQVSRRERIIASSVKVHAGNCELYNAIGASVDLDSYFAGDKRATVVLTQPRPIRAVNGTARMSTSWTGVKGWIGS